MATVILPRKAQRQQQQPLSGPRWKRVIGWTVASLIILLVIAGFFVLRSQGFHRYVLNQIIASIQESTGGRVELANWDFHFSTLTADIYGFVLNGTEPATARPLAQVDHVGVGLKILSVLHHSVDLQQITIDHPVIDLLVDKQGNNNIPQPPKPKNPSGKTVNVFDLAIKHVLLGRGE